MRSRGLALILVVGVLAVLAVLGSAFAVLSRLERKAAFQRVLGTQAQLLARSGIEDALARVAAGQDPRYRGEDWNDDGLVTGLESSAELFQPGIANLLDCPARFAMAPSFFRRHPTDLDFAGLNRAPDRILVDGRQRGVSGGLSSGHWTLKVEDESGKLNVNGGFLDARNRDADGIPDHCDTAVRQSTALSDTGIGWNAQLVRTLDALGGLPSVGVPSLGTLAVQRRPKGGYCSLLQVQQAVGTAKDLSPWLTLWSWPDLKVIHPNAWRTQKGKDGFSDLKKDRRPPVLEEGGRCPVNLNTATSEVLTAMLNGLSGKVHAEPLLPSAPVLGPLGAAVAGRILARRAQKPFRTWSDFQDFCDGLALDGTVTVFSNWYFGGGSLGGADLLKAALNPNTQSGKELPDQIRWLWTDKTDLWQWSTEGSLGPTGVFRVESSARILGTGGRLLAQTGLEGRVEAFSLFRQTHQADFVGSRPALPQYLSLASAPDRTSGISVPPASAAAWWGTASPGQGLALTTYPCPPPAVTAGKATEYDGYVGLATVETAPQDPDGGALLFLHHFDDSWDADYGAVPARQVPGQDDARLLAPLTESVWPAWNVEPNTLLPDGFHAQRFRAPAFLARSNLPLDDGTSNRGVVGYWVKRLALSATVNQSPLIYQDFDFSCVRIDAQGSQAFQIGQVDDTWGVCMENRADAWDDNWVDPDTGNTLIRYERQQRAEYRTLMMTLEPGLRWHLVTAFVDTDESVGFDVRLLVKGADGAPPDAASPSNYTNDYFTLTGQDLFEPGLLFTLGRPFGSADIFGGGTAYRTHHILDEFAICDFTDSSSAVFSKVEGWASDRFKDGRYYKQDDGAYLSAVLRPDPFGPVRILSAAWTALLPSERRLGTFADWNGTIQDNGVPRDPDPYLQDAGIRVELVSEPTVNVQNGGVLQELSQGGAVGRWLSGFRYRVRIQPRLDPVQIFDQPVLETPIFDDITFAWQKAGGPRVLSWER